MIFQPGSQCGNYYLLIDGTIRVFVMTSSGREVLLYRVSQGQGCVITTSCLLGEDPYNVYGITDDPVRAFAIPSMLFHETLNHSEAFRNFVFRGFAHRLSRVLSRLEDLVEGDIDQMLAEALISQHQKNKVTLTHQKLAEHIGTAREVISRHLKHLENKGWIELSRGSIRLLDINALTEQARQGSNKKNSSAKF
jgi:CRP/FNR family transcriptional regulator